MSQSRKHNNITFIVLMAATELGYQSLRAQFDHRMQRSIGPHVGGTRDKQRPYPPLVVAPLCCCLHTALRTFVASAISDNLRIHKSGTKQPADNLLHRLGLAFETDIQPLFMAQFTNRMHGSAIAVARQARGEAFSS